MVVHVKSSQVYFIYGAQHHKCVSICPPYVSRCPQTHDSDEDKLPADDQETGVNK